MRLTIPLSFLLILFASCNRYQYATISSAGLAMNDQQEFVTGNDSVQLIYNFYGEDAPVNLRIENRLDVPVYIDWRQSSLVVNDKAISYLPQNLSVSGVIDTYRNPASYPAATHTSTFDATVAVPPAVDFIPPHSYITKRPLGITNRSVAPDSAFHREKMRSYDGNYYHVKKARYTETSSPIRFRSYLTVMVGEVTGKPVVYEHAFYVSELITTGLELQHFGNTFQNKGNRYYVKETTGFGRTATGFGVMAGTALIAGAAAAVNPDSDCNNCKY